MYIILCTSLFSCLCPIVIESALRVNRGGLQVVFVSLDLFHYNSHEARKTLTEAVPKLQKVIQYFRYMEKSHRTKVYICV